MQEAALRSIIESLVPNPEDFEFIDIGSGKGKAMLVASTYPFKRVRGVELSPRLHQTALANWSRFSECGLVQCQDVAFSCQDARKLDDLSGNVLVFLFNPLSPGPMREFVSRLETMVKAKDCSLMIAYLAPRAREAFEQAQELQQLLETRRLLVFGTSDLTLPDGAMPRLCARFDSWKT
mgnify:CR=1 FL=1